MKEFIPELDEQGFMLHWKDLKKSHRGTYWMLKKYLKQIEAIKKDADLNPYQHPDIPMVKDAMSDNSFAVGWLHTGKRPGNKRGIESRKAYAKKKVVMDPLVMQAIIKSRSPVEAKELSAEQKFKIEDALSRLSPRERECFELRIESLYELPDIAELLDISIGSVEVYLTRAKRKIAEDLDGDQRSLFLQM
jgi:RNA polymerase sigma factor (sigma-70 family)